MKKLIEQADLDALYNKIQELEDELSAGDSSEELSKLHDDERCLIPFIKDPESSHTHMQWNGPNGSVIVLLVPVGDTFHVGNLIGKLCQDDRRIP